MRLSDRKSKFFISFKTSIHKVSFNTLISVTGAVFLSANLIFYLSSLCKSLSNRLFACSAWFFLSTGFNVTPAAIMDICHDNERIYVQQHQDWDLYFSRYI